MSCFVELSQTYFGRYYRFEFVNTSLAKRLLKVLSPDFFLYLCCSAIDFGDN